MPGKQKITTFLWFDGNAEEAADHYVSIFKNSKIVEVVRRGDTLPGPKGSVLIVRFQLEGQEFIALNGGPLFTFTEAISLSVAAGSQAEVDQLWDALTEGGEEVQCGWLKDRYGLSWQINPTRLGELLSDPDPERAKRATEAMLQMKKIDIAALERAADG